MRWLMLALCAGLLLLSEWSVSAGGGEKVVIDGFASVTPAAWKKEKPANRLRAFQFSLPRAEGDPANAELVIMPDLRESPEKSLDRWKALFTPPAGQDEPTSKVEKFNVGKIKVTYLDVVGTYIQLARPELPKSQGTPRPNYRMLVLIFTTPENSHKISLVGPARTVGQRKNEFDSWLKAFK